MTCRRCTGNTSFMVLHSQGREADVHSRRRARARALAFAFQRMACAEAMERARWPVLYFVAFLACEQTRSPAARNRGQRTKGIFAAHRLLHLPR